MLICTRKMSIWSNFITCLVYFNVFSQHFEPQDLFPKSPYLKAIHFLACCFKNFYSSPDTSLVYFSFSTEVELACYVFLVSLHNLASDLFVNSCYGKPYTSWYVNFENLESHRDNVFWSINFLFSYHESGLQCNYHARRTKMFITLGRKRIAHSSSYLFSVNSWMCSSLTYMVDFDKVSWSRARLC